MRLPNKIQAGTRCQTTAHVIDLLPTFARLAGSSLKANSELETPEGVDLTPVLTAPDFEIQRDQPLFFHWGGNRAVIDGKWKSVFAKSSQQWELYDRTNDRTETDDLASEYPERVNTLSHQWEDWARRTGVIRD